MPSMPFISFWNPQTFHLFQWTVYSGQVPVDSLLDRAWKELADNEDRTDFDTSLALRDSLAGILEELIDDKLQELTGAALPEEAFGYEQFTDLELSLNSSAEIPQHRQALVELLFFPMLIEAIWEVDFSKVAETILRLRGKWNPDKSIPEAR